MVKGKPLLPSGASKERLFSSTQELNAYLETPKAKSLSGDDKTMMWIDLK